MTGTPWADAGEAPSAARDGARAELLRQAPLAWDSASANRRLDADIVELLKRAGVYRALVARRFGGDEVTPGEFLHLIETISSVDGSTGWVASFGFSAIYLSALPLATLETIYAEGPDIVFAGGIFPPQPAQLCEGGIEVSGRWSWGSGCTGAALIGVGVKVEDGVSTGGLPKIAVMPRDSVRIEDNWAVNGLKGTGSHDMVVDGVFVPHEWTFIRGGPSSLDSPLYRYPSMALASQVLAVVALGCARGALDHLRGKAAGRTSITGSPALGDRAHVQIDLAKAEAKLRSARAFFYEATEHAFDLLCKGDELPLEAAAELRLAATNAARVGADVTADVYRLSGTDGIFTANPIARFMQDAMIVPQHAFLSESTWQSAGRAMLGLDCPSGYP